MPLNTIEKAQWQPFFDRVSDALGARSIDIDISAPGIGEQREARHIALTGLSYDSKDDVFAVIGEELEHNIAHPREVRVDLTPDAVREIEIVDGEGGRHRLTLVDPLLLPAPH